MVCFANCRTGMSTVQPPRPPAAWQGGGRPGPGPRAPGPLQTTRSADPRPPGPLASTTEEDPKPSQNLGKCPQCQERRGPRESPPPTVNMVSVPGPSWCLVGGPSLRNGPSPCPTHQGPDPIKAASPTPPRSPCRGSGALSPQPRSGFHEPSCLCPPPRPRCTQLLWVRPTCCRHIGLGWGGGSSRLRPQAQAPATPTSSQGGSDKGGGKDPQQARRGCRLPRRPSEAPRPGALVTPLPRAGQRRPARCLVKRETLGGTLGPLPPSPTWSPPRVAPGAGLCWVQESRERPRRGRGREVSPTWVSGWTWKGRTGHWGGEPATRPRGARPCAGPRQRGGGTRRCRRRAC